MDADVSKTMSPRPGWGIVVSSIAFERRALTSRPARDRMRATCSRSTPYQHAVRRGTFLRIYVSDFHRYLRVVAERDRGRARDGRTGALHADRALRSPPPSLLNQRAGSNRAASTARAQQAEKRVTRRALTFTSWPFAQPSRRASPFSRRASISPVDETGRRPGS